MLSPGLSSRTLRSCILLVTVAAAGLAACGSDDDTGLFSGAGGLGGSATGGRTQAGGNAGEEPNEDAGAGGGGSTAKGGASGKGGAAGKGGAGGTTGKGGTGGAAGASGAGTGGNAGKGGASGKGGGAGKGGAGGKGGTAGASGTGGKGGTAGKGGAAGKGGSLGEAGASGQPNPGGSGGSGGGAIDTCAHDLCELGAALPALCSEGASMVCGEAPFCCKTGNEWDGTCQALAAARVGCDGAAPGYASCLAAQKETKHETEACIDCYEACGESSGAHASCDQDVREMDGRCRDEYCDPGDDACVCECAAVETNDGADGLGCVDVSDFTGECCFAMAKAYTCVATECAAVCD